jgi:hypothetical protein
MLTETCAATAGTSRPAPKAAKRLPLFLATFEDSQVLFEGRQVY